MKKSNGKITHRYEGLFLVEGIDCNPNGDPDNDGAPRVDEVSGHHTPSGASVTRRISDSIDLMYEGKPPYMNLIRRGTNIEAGILAARDAAGVKASGKNLSDEDRMAITKKVCEMYYQSRSFGAVLQVGNTPAFNINGSITIMYGRSVYPVSVQEHAITRVCETNEKQAKEREMGRKFLIPHVVYTQKFFVNPFHAQTNGFTVHDLAIFLDRLVNLFENRRSSMGGELNVKGIWLFEHSNMLGDTQSWKLFDRFQITCDNPQKARSIKEYDIKVDLKDLPKGMRVLNIEDFLGGVDAIVKKLS